MPSKNCPKCGVTKDYEEFYVNNRLKDGISTYCVPCTKVFLRESYEKRKEKQGLAAPRPQKDKKPVEIKVEKQETPKTKKDVEIKAKVNRKKIETKSVRKPQEKVCENCEKTKPFLEFFKSPNSKDGFNPYCKSCLQEKKREKESQEEIIDEPLWITELML
ncbi:hypothetical protein IT568_07275 [bacterium]|nr:hypothetical protein [bacterium]